MRSITSRTRIVSRKWSFLVIALIMVFGLVPSGELSATTAYAASPYETFRLGRAPRVPTPVTRAPALPSTSTTRVNPIGVSSHLDRLTQSEVSNQLTLMQQAGVAWTRFDFAWVQMERPQGVWDFSRFDYIVDTAKSKGINVIALLPQYGVPKWANGGADWNYPPSRPQDYANYAAKVAEHFKGRVTLYELGNEPDWKGFWQPAPDVATYTAFLKAGYTAIKATDPSAKVISAGLTQNNPVTFLNGMYQNGVKGYFDYLGYHPYTWPESPDTGAGFTNMASLRQTMLSRGDDKQIMVTEVGWPSTAASGGVTETTQASYINRVFQKIMFEDYKYVPIAFVYSFVDDGANKSDPENNYGVLRNDLSKKPSYQTVQAAREKYDSSFKPINP